VSDALDTFVLDEPLAEAYADLREQLKFEMLLADVSARFVNLPADLVDQEIEDAQRRICQCLALDHSSVWQASSDEPQVLLLTHLYRDPKLPPRPSRMDGDTYFPWAQRRLKKKEILYVPRTADVQTEAPTDYATWQAFGIKSTLGIPLWIGDGPVFGVLSFDATTKERKCPASLVKRLQLLAHIFANALARKRAEQAMRESETRLKLAASAGAGLWMLEPISGCIWATDEAKELFGLLPTEEVDVAKFLSLVHPADREAVNRTIEQAMKSGDDSGVEYRIIRPDGQMRWISARGRRCSGEPDRLMGVSRDITDRKQAEEVRIRHSAIVQSCEDAIISMDLRGIITDWNAAAQRIYGYTEEEALGRHISLTIPSERRNEETTLLERITAGERVEHFETVRVRKDGRRVDVALTLSAIRDSDGRVIGYSKIARDITESKRAHEELQKSYSEIKRLRERLQAESQYLQEEIRDIGRFDEIVGRSDALRKVLKKVEQVAPTDSVVLITGETGTGKELIARAIHALSQRKDRAMVKVDCSALPPTLIESELFGREKGAYTGATSRQIGRFETADGSTLFLDEIGELGMDVQARLLRIIQDGEFERLGSARTSRINVRLIAATHRDLAEEVNHARFREDLFYRVNVFSIHVPPLRERPEDIPLLVTAFIREFEKKMDKRIRVIASKTMDELKRYPWPGNVRELRNVIENAVILTSGEKLNVELPKIKNVARAGTLREAEHEHICSTLEKTGWRIKGPNGAAAILGMKSSTLYTAMRRLNIPTKSEKRGT